MTTGHSVETLEFLTTKTYALSSYALTCAALREGDSWVIIGFRNSSTLGFGMYNRTLLTTAGGGTCNCDRAFCLLNLVDVQAPAAVFARLCYGCGSLLSLVDVEASAILLTRPSHAGVEVDISAEGGRGGLKRNPRRDGGRALCGACETNRHSEPRAAQTWLRTDGVNTNGAAAKVMDFDRLGKKVRPGTFRKIQVALLMEVPKRSLCNIT